MKNLESFGVQKLDLDKLALFNGGSIDPDGCSGCNFGKTVREVLGTLWETRIWIGISF